MMEMTLLLEMVVPTEKWMTGILVIILRLQAPAQKYPKTALLIMEVTRAHQVRVEAELPALGRMLESAKVAEVEH